MTGFAVGSNVAISSSDTILSAFGKTQAQLNNKLSLSGGTLSGSLYFTGGVYNIDAGGTGPTGYVYFRNATSASTFRVYPETGNLYFSGSLIEGTVPWARLDGVPSTFAPSAHTHTFASLTSKPTTLSGYGITDAYTKAGVNSLACYVGAYNFSNGFLVKTNVARTLNSMLVLHIKGNSYGGLVPINTLVQVYNYTTNDAIISTGALNNGYKINEVKVFYYDNLVYFWVPQQTSFMTMTFQLLRTEEQANRVVSVTNEAVPASGVEKMVTITPRTAWFENTLTNLSQLTDNIGIGSHIANNANPHSVTKAQVGLGNVLNVASYSKTESDGKYLPLVGGEITTNALKVSSQFIFESNTVTEYREGARFNLSTGGWGGMVIGGVRGSISGITGAW